MTLPPVRMLAQPLLTRPYFLARASTYSSPFLRVATKYRTDQSSPSSSHAFVLDHARLSRYRTYATSAATKPASRPKAHTGRTPAKRTRATTTTTPKKAGPRVVASKPAPRTKKAVKPRAKPKTKKRTVTKVAQKKLEVTKARDLKEKALLNPPKQLPATAWTIVFSEGAAKGTRVTGDNARSAAQRYRNWSPEEHEVWFPILGVGCCTNLNAAVQPYRERK